MADKPSVKNIQAIVTILAEKRREAIHGQIFEISGHSLTMHLARALPLGAAVRVETSDTLLLCEVCSLEPLEAGYRASMKVSHVLHSLFDLERLNRAILGEPRDSTGPRVRTTSSSRCET